MNNRNNRNVVVVVYCFTIHEVVLKKEKRVYEVDVFVDEKYINK